MTIELLHPLWVPPRPAIIRPAPKELVGASFMPGMFPGGATLSQGGGGATGLITFVGAAEAAAPGNNQDCTITLPSMQEDDIVIVGAVIDDDDAATWNLPTGYTSINAITNDNPSSQLSYKFMGATPDTTAVVPGIAGSNRIIAGIAMVFRGVNTTTPIDATTTTSTATSGLPNPPAITTATNGAIVVAWGFLDDDSEDAATLSGYNDVQSKSAGASPNLSASVMVGWKEISVAGSEDPPAFGGTGSDDNDGVTIALRPAA